MAAEILPAARERVFEVWEYTEKKWGVEQADKYIRELIDAANRLPRQRTKWKPVRDEALAGVYVSQYRHHYIFFKEFESGTIGVVSILHENMDLPSRLKEDLKLD